MYNFAENIIASVLLFLGAIALLAGLSLLLAFPTEWCWNATMPQIFHLVAISWGQAWCLSFLAGIFFKSTNTSSSKSKD